MALFPTSIVSAEALGTAQANQEVVATSIVSAEALGTAQANQEVVATSIVSAEALGTAQANQELESVGVASAESFGIFQFNQEMDATSIVSAESVGDSTVVLDSILNATSIVSAESLGAVQVNQELEGVGVASAESFGVFQANQEAVTTSIVSAESLGTAQANQEAVATSIVSAEALGTAQANQELVVTSIVSAESVGDSTIVLDQILDATSIASAESLGATQINQEVVSTSITSGEGFGDSVVVPAQFLTTTSIASAEDFGAIALGKSHVLIADGGMSAGGGAILKRIYKPLGNGPSGPGVALRGEASVRILLEFQQKIIWQTRAKVDVTQTVFWNTGRVPLRWYRVQGCCRYPTAVGDGLGEAGLIDEGVPGGCDVIPFQSNDEGCTGALGKNQFIQNIIATNVKEVCRTLKELRWKWPICDIQRFSRPAESQFVDEGDECNILEPVEFCSDPECIEFCVEVDAIVKIGASVSLIDTFIVQFGSGGVVLGGSAAARVVTPFYKGTGGVVLGGSASLSSGRWSYKPDSEESNIILDGESSVKSSYWSYVGSGNIGLNGEASFISPLRGIRAEGGISLTGSGQYLLRSIYRGAGGITLGGEASLSTYVYRGTGGVTLGGAASAFITQARYHGSGGIVISGEAPVVSPDWNFTGSGSISLGGVAPVLSTSAQWMHTGTGGVVLGGVSPMRSSEDGDFWYKGSGGVVLGGTVFPWRYVGSGGIILGGTSSVGGTWSGEYNVSIGAKAYVQDIEVNFFNQDFDFNEFENSLRGLSFSASTKCSNCTEIPLVLEMSHNLNDTAILREFLFRNNLSMPEIMKLRYSPTNKSWQGNLHYRGSADTFGDEDWSILVEWSCVDELGSIELGSFIWKFSLYIKRKNILSGMDFDSRILLAFPATEICEEASRVGLDFSFAFDTLTQFVNAERDIIVDVRLLYDNIGLFKSDFWVEKPDLLVNIAEAGDANTVQRQDIKPIFPKDEVITR